MRRLYVSDGSPPVFFIDSSMAEAACRHSNARPANDDDIRAWWTLEKLDDQTTEDACRRLRIKRQTLALWRRRAGCQSKPRLDPALIARAVADVATGRTIEAVARELGIQYDTLRRKVRAAGVAVGREPISDDDLVRLAAGRSWSELAAVVKYHPATLQRRVYKDRDLATRMRAVMIRKNATQRKDK